MVDPRPNAGASRVPEALSTEHPQAHVNLCSALEQRWQSCRSGITEQGVHPRASFARLQLVGLGSEPFYAPCAVHPLLLQLFEHEEALRNDLSGISHGETP